MDNKLTMIFVADNDNVIERNRLQKTCKSGTLFENSKESKKISKKFCFDNNSDYICRSVFSRNKELNKIKSKWEKITETFLTHSLRDRKGLIR